MIMKMKVSWSWFMFCFGAYFSGRHFGSENKGPERNNLVREGNLVVLTFETGPIQHFFLNLLAGALPFN